MVDHKCSTTLRTAKGNRAYQRKIHATCSQARLQPHRTLPLQPCDNAHSRPQIVFALMQRRTYDINITEDYCPKWDVRDGIRELLQNFFDGLCSTTFGPRSLSEIQFLYKEEGKEGSSRWLKIWRAVYRNGNKETELGRVTWNLKSDTFVILNKDVTLSADKVLKLGPTTKKNKRSIGGHGEGLKIGVLAILRDDFKIRFRTNGDTWHWSLRKGRLSDVPTLHCVTTECTKATDLEIIISDISFAEIDIDDFLYLSTVLRPVTDSRCDEGFLLETGAPFSMSSLYNRVYVKGIFVQFENNIHVPINLSNARVHRDRRLVADRNYLTHCIGKIWATALSKETDLEAEERRYTRRLLQICRANETSLEYLSLQYMTTAQASCLIKHIRETVSSKAFPYVKGNPGAPEVIISVLKKDPFPCTPYLFDLLKKNGEILNLDEAQEQAFANSQVASEEVSRRPLAQLVFRFVEAVSSARAKVSIRTGETLSVLRKEDVVLISSAIVEDLCEPDLQKALTSLKLVERELRKGKEPKEVEQLELDASKFIAGHKFRSLVPEAQQATEPNLGSACDRTTEGDASGGARSVTGATEVEIVDVAQKTTISERQEEEEVEGSEGEGVSLSPRLSAPTAQPGGLSNLVDGAEDVVEGGDSVGSEQRVPHRCAQINCENDDETGGNECAVAGAHDEADEVRETGAMTPSLSKPSVGRRLPGLRRSLSRSPNQRPLKMKRRERIANRTSGNDEKEHMLAYDRTVIVVNEVTVEVLQAIPSEGEVVEKGTVVVPREMGTGLEDFHVVSDMKLDLTGMEGQGFSVVRKDGDTKCFSVRVHSKKE